jgi:hypothetical protein
MSMDGDKNAGEIIGDIRDGYELVKAAKEVAEFIGNEYDGMIENMDTDIARNFIDNVVTNDSYM